MDNITSPSACVCLDSTTSYGGAFIGTAPGQQATGSGTVATCWSLIIANEPTFKKARDDCVRPNTSAPPGNFGNCMTQVKNSPALVAACCEGPINSNITTSTVAPGRRLMMMKKLFQKI